MAKPLGLLLALVIAIASLSVVTLLRPKPPADHYQLLGVGRSAERQEIKSAFRKLALTAHPDKVPDCDAACKTRFHNLQDAFDTLTHADKRALYDADLAIGDIARQVRNNEDSRGTVRLRTRRLACKMQPPCFGSALPPPPARVRFQWTHLRSLLSFKLLGYLLFALIVLTILIGECMHLAPSNRRRFIAGFSSPRPHAPFTKTRDPNKHD
jgi:hypothetical protein